MKAVLICPAERAEVSALEEFTPLVNLSILGNPFIHHWLEYLAVCGIKNVTVLAADRPEQIRAEVGDGSRWGVQVEIIPESHELTLEEARQKLGGSDDIILIDHLPGLPTEKLFASYVAFYSTVHRWIEKNSHLMQIGLKEIRPGIWAGLHSQISPRATLTAPCWIGENVLINADAEVGPMTILERGVVVESGATITHAWIGKETFVGNFTQVNNSLAFGNTLVNFMNASVVIITDPFLLCALQDREISVSAGNLFGRCVALIVLALTSPFALVTMLKARFLGHRTFRQRRAIASHSTPQQYPTFIYYEFSSANGWWKRWPQLWSIVCGEFTWVGNRPLTTFQAGQLANEFERLWLAAPIGLISKGDSEGCSDLSSDEAHAHASFYAAQANWRLDLMILFRTVKHLAGRKKPASVQNDSATLKTRRFTLLAR